MVGRRPTDTVWSALEYGCHVRDVFRVYDGRLARMLTEDDPLYPNWDQDATAVEDRYLEQQPHVVSFARYLIHDPVHHLHDVTEGHASLGNAG